MLIGTVGALLFEKIGVPHIVVYLLSGLIIGNTVFYGVNLDVRIHTWFIFIENVALGLIGFKIGTELKLKKLFKERKTVLVLLFAETIGTFFIVFFVTILVSQDYLLAVILAGLATATAPAATVEIFRKFKSEGPLTRLAQWILALDDIVAVFVIETVLVFLALELGHDISPLGFVIGIIHEIGFALVLGLGAGLFLEVIIERMDEEIPMMELTLALLLASMGVAFYLQTSIITTTMMIGVTTTNLGGDNYERARDKLEILMSPILLLFFTLVGMRVSIDNLLTFPLLALLYLIARTVGKVGGFKIGGKFVDLQLPVKKNIGYSFLAQGGVALGLATIISQKLIDANMGALGIEIEDIIILTTLVSEFLGSFGAKFAITQAGEINLS